MVLSDHPLIPGLSESGNMLIMTLAHAQATGDGSIISQHVCGTYLNSDLVVTNNIVQYDLLKDWTEYLVNNSLNPGSQYVVFEMGIETLRTSISRFRQSSAADGIQPSNQTNLALKGIVGIGAMARMSGFAAVVEDQSRYQVH